MAVQQSLPFQFTKDQLVNDPQIWKAPSHFSLLPPDICKYVTNFNSSKGLNFDAVQISFWTKAKAVFLKVFTFGIWAHVRNKQLNEALVQQDIVRAKQLVSYGVSCQYEVYKISDLATEGKTSSAIFILSQMMPVDYEDSDDCERNFNYLFANRLNNSLKNKLISVKNSKETTESIMDVLNSLYFKISIVQAKYKLLKRDRWQIPELSHLLINLCYCTNPVILKKFKSLGFNVYQEFSKVWVATDLERLFTKHFNQTKIFYYKFLLEICDSDLNSPMHPDETFSPIQKLIESDDKEVLEELIKEGCDPNKWTLFKKDGNYFRSYPVKCIDFLLEEKLISNEKINEIFRFFMAHNTIDDVFRKKYQLIFLPFLTSENLENVSKVNQAREKMLAKSQEDPDNTMRYITEFNGYRLELFPEQKA